jgi:hypothetical protein
MDFGTIRAIKGDLLLSPSLPRLGIQISPDFIYLGNLHYISANTYHVEQFIYLNPNGLGHVTHMLLVQFSGFLGNKEGVYDYSIQPSVQLEGDEYRYELSVIDINDFIKRFPATELAHAADYIHQRSYTLAGDMQYQRFTRLVSPDKRNEFVIEHLESIGEVKHASSAPPQKNARDVLESARNSFTIRH